LRFDRTKGIRQFDAVPDFVDVDPVTRNIDVDQLETRSKASSGDGTRLPPSLRDTVAQRVPVAVLPVHVGRIGFGRRRPAPSDA
jgi:dTDP-4-amino-4,6-dideoxygalactose transaminase